MLPAITLVVLAHDLILVWIDMLVHERGDAFL